jgi:uncharacterized protein (TIGR01777 family)
MNTVMITGGTGLIGTALAKALLERNYEVIILSRFPEKYSSHNPGLSYAKWNIQDQAIDISSLKRSQYIIHLAGAGIADKRWTSKRKKAIVESRTRGSRLLVKALTENANNVTAVISSSGIGWYGPSSPAEKGTETRPFVETDPAAEDFLGVTGMRWEASIDPVTSLGKRLVKFRTGIVLSNHTGALKKFNNTLRFGVAPILGNGKQVMSWIHIDDLVRLYLYALENEKLHGVYNAVAPQTVTNKKFILQLARSTRGRFFVPVFVPSFLLKMIFGEVSIEVLKSVTVSSEKIRREGFQFQYPSLQSALHHLAK